MGEDRLSNLHSYFDWVYIYVYNVLSSVIVACACVRAPLSVLIKWNNKCFTKTLAIYENRLLLRVLSIAVSDNSEPEPNCQHLNIINIHSNAPLLL